MSRAWRAEIRQILLGMAAIAAGFAALANLFCAAAYGSVFLARGEDWVAFDASPVRFILSVAVSLVGAPFGTIMGVVAIKSARDERRFIERLYTGRPRYEDESRRYEARP